MKNIITDVRPIKPICGNGIDEIVFEQVVSSLNNQDCENKGPDYMLYNNEDYRELARDPYNAMKYHMVEGFSNTSTTNIWCFVLLIILFLVLLYKVLV